MISIPLPWNCIAASQGIDPASSPPCYAICFFLLVSLSHTLSLSLTHTHSYFSLTLLLFRCVQVCMRVHAFECMSVQVFRRHSTLPLFPSHLIHHFTPMPGRTDFWESNIQFGASHLMLWIRLLRWRRRHRVFVLTFITGEITPQSNFISLFRKQRTKSIIPSAYLVWLIKCEEKRKPVRLEEKKDHLCA